MRRTASWIFVGLLAFGGGAACDGEDGNGNDTEQNDNDDNGGGGGGDDNATGDVEDFCNRAAEFIAKVDADPTNRDLFDEGEALVEEGQEFTGEDAARADECISEIVAALARLGG